MIQNIHGMPSESALVFPLPLYSPFVAARIASTPAASPPAVIAFFKLRRDFVLDDTLGERVRHRTLESIAHLHEHLSGIDENEQADSVFLIALPQLPLLKNSERVVLNRRIRLHVAPDGDDDLIGSITLELLELRVELRDEVGGNDARVIIEPLRRFRRHHFRR